MDKELKLYSYIDGVNDIPFPSSEDQAIITSFKYDSKRMGGAPTISATLMHEKCLDKLWEYNVYATFNGEKYFIKNIPSSSYNNTDILYKHDIELVSERIVLDNVYFYDVVSKDVVYDKPVSNNSKFTFFGDIHEFASRLNCSLQYSKMDYTVVVDDGISSEGKFVSFEDTFFSNAIQESYNTYEIPYYFDGKTIHFGFTNNAITQTFKYGVDESLLSIQKQNANYKVVNRVTGTGSSDNIPYYYPNLNEWGIITAQVGWDKESAGYDWNFSQENELELKASDVVIVDEEKFATNISPDDRVICYGFKWYRNTINGEEILLDDIGIKIINHDGNQGCPNAYFWFGQKRMGYAMPVQSNLMPPIYRSTEGEERFYNALNNTYISPETGTYYEFENQYTDGKQKEQIVSFEDIKPSIVGMTNANGQRIDTFLEFAYDENDNDETDKEGNYLHPYFFAKLPKYDGTYGFNLFDHAIDEEEMTISMTSGNCGACEWTVMVDSETLKNTVQVDSDGNLLRDKNGNVSFGAAQDKQNDTINNEVWIALKKDIDTFGVVMPNVTHDYKPSAGDTFVILHILLPNSYIFAAENRLKEELIKYMAANNSEKFNFSIAFSRIYFAENPDVLDKLNENARIQIEYNGELHELYVSSFAYSMDSDSPLPNITVELSDTLTIQKNALQTAISQVENSIMKNIGSIDWLKLGLAYFLRKDTDDRSRGKVASDKGFEVGKFVSGTSGAMMYIDKLNNTSVAEVDRLYVRIKAYFEQLEIINVNSIGGKQIISPAGSIRCKSVETNNDTDYYRCYILAEQDGDKIENRFKIGDQAYCQMFNAKEGVENNISNRYYWRLVVGVGEDYIDLSKSDCDTNSDAPMANDIICQRGNRNDIDRQNFMEFSSVDSFSPSITLYQKVDSYSLVDKEVIQYGVDKTTGKGFMNIYGEMYVGDREQTSYMRYTQENGLEIRGKLVTKGGDDVENYLTSVQDYMDGLIETYYGGYTPTNDNYPSIEWSTDEEKKQHINDVFINTEEFKDEETTPNAGLTWQWSCDENGVYGWQVIADKDIANSYKNAVLANKDAIAAKNSSDEVAKAGDEIKGITDSAFADDTVTESEKSQIDSKILIITNLKSSLQSTYSALKDNELLAGIEKANLTNGYSALVSAINELTSSITSVMDDNTITSVERALISGKFEAFYSKQGDYNKYVLSALKAIQGTINAVSIRALDELGGYEYLKKALKESTVIKNGLIQSSVVALGYTDTEGEYHIMAGTNGLVDDVLTDKTPAIWAGGGMIDKEASEENASNPYAADFLVRMDGSGYAAGGKLSWDITGKVKADPLSFFVGEATVGGLLASFQVVLKADGKSPDYLNPQVPFRQLEISTDLKMQESSKIAFGDAYIRYDKTNNAVYVEKSDGTSVNFYATGEVSAFGSGGSGSGSGGSVVVYDGLDSTDVGVALSANQGRVLKELIDNIEVGLDESALSTYLTDNGYAQKSDFVFKNIDTASISSSDGPATTELTNLGYTSGCAIVSSPGIGYDGMVIQFYTDYMRADTAFIQLFSQSEHDKMLWRSSSGGSFSGRAWKTLLDTNNYEDYCAPASHVDDTIAHVTNEEKGRWNTAYNYYHEHQNLPALNQITLDMVTLWNTICNKLYVDDNGYLHSSVAFVGDSEISAYGAGSGSSGSSVVVYDGLDSTSSDIALSANQGRILKAQIDAISSSGGGLDETELAEYLTNNNYAKKSDIPTSLPASDVYEWAKASTKPSYSYSEISGTPTSLKNPYAITIFGKSYDGSAAVSIYASDLPDESFKYLGSSYNMSTTYYPDTSDLTNITGGNTCAMVNGPGIGYDGMVIQFYTNYTRADTAYVQLFCGLNTELTWRCAGSSFSGRNWKKLIDNTNYTNFVKQIGTANVGSTSKPIYLSAGVPTACGDKLELGSAYIQYDSSNNAIKVIGTSGGNVNLIATGEVTAYSDARLKQNVKTITNRGFVRPVEYDKDGKHSIGFIAQEVQELYPELVMKGKDKDGYLALNYQQYTAVLQAQIIELNNKLKNMEAKLYEMAC